LKKSIPILLLLVSILFVSGWKLPDLGDITGSIGSAGKVVETVSKASRSITEDEEYYVGRAVAAMILDKYAFSTDVNVTWYVNLIGKDITLSSDKPNTYNGYHFGILNTEEINAFACPGGTIFISMGMIRMIANEDELAAVLAHEIAHIANRDGISAIKNSRWTEALTVMGTEAAKKYGPQEVAQLVSIFEGSIEDVFKAVVTKGYSRSQEYSADETALKYLEKSGYNPAALLDVLKRLSSRDSSSGGIMQTHPASQDRIENLSGKVPSIKVDPKWFQARSFRFNNTLKK